MNAKKSYKIKDLILDGRDQENLLALIEIIRETGESREKVLLFLDYLENRIINKEEMIG